MTEGSRWYDWYRVGVEAGRETVVKITATALAALLCASLLLSVKSVRVWLWASAHMSHGGLLLLVVLLLTALGVMARLAIDLRKGRVNASGADTDLQRPDSRAPEGKQQATTVVDAAVTLTPLLEAALSALLARNGEQLSLDVLLQEMRFSLTDLTIRAHLAHELEEAAQAHIVRIVRGSQTNLYYSLTPSGRGWATGKLAAEKLKRASAGARTMSFLHNGPRRPLPSDQS